MLGCSLIGILVIAFYHDEVDNSDSPAEVLSGIFLYNQTLLNLDKLQL